MTTIYKMIGAAIPYPIILAGRKIFHAGLHRCKVCRSWHRRRLDSGYGFPVLEELQVVGGLKRRADLCPICHSGSRERLVWFFLTRLFGIFEKSGAGLQIAHFAPEKGLSLRLRTIFPASYRAYDFAPKRYRHIAKITFQNLEKLSLGSRSVELLICNHVLEHVSDVQPALDEVKRVLARDGLAIMQVPIALKLDQTRIGGEDMTPEERISQFGQDDHLRLFTQDGYVQTLRSAGLSVELYDPFERDADEATKWALDPFEKLFLIRRADSE